METHKEGRRGLLLRAAACLLVLALCLGLWLPAAQGAGNTFSDVKPGSWYYDTVTAMAQEGILKGYPDGSFRPNQTISGAEFAAVAARVGGLTESQGQTNHWAAGLLQTALDAGWYDWDELPPTGETYDQPMQRQVAVSLLMRGLLPDQTGDYGSEAGKLSDLSSLDGRYYNRVFAAYACGVAQGDDKGNFNPRGSLTRAEACALIQRAEKIRGGATVTPDPTPTPEPEQPAATLTGGVTKNGWLQVKGTQLCNEKGQTIVLHGMSSHGIQWYPQYTSKQAIANTAAFGANLFRVAMYTGEGGYLSNPSKVKQQTFAAVDAALANDMYVILDWHILSDGNPRTSQAQAIAFFQEAAARYANQPGVLYEICNEPNGNVTWARDIKPYAQAVVTAIRAKAPKSVILIGSGTWSQDILDPAKDPVQGTNLMYTCHFYAGTHGAWLRDRIDSARKLGLPIFISEWGTSAADGSGGVYLTQSKAWLDFLDDRGISWANWSLCDKSETSAALKPGTNANKTWTTSDLSQSGQFVFSRF